MTQMTLDFARRQRDRGMGQAELGAVNACEDWPDLALSYLRLYATQHPDRFTAEDVLEAADKWGLMVPPNDRAWGPVFLRAAKQGLIRKDGTGVCRKRHLSICVAWRSVICRAKR